MNSIEYIMDNIAEQKWSLLTPNHDAYKLALHAFAVSGDVYCSLNNSVVYILHGTHKNELIKMSFGCQVCYKGPEIARLYEAVVEETKHYEHAITLNTKIMYRLIDAVNKGYTITLESDINAGPRFLDFREFNYDLLRVGSVFKIFIAKNKGSVSHIIVYEVLKHAYSMSESNKDIFFCTLVNLYRKYLRTEHNCPVQSENSQLKDTEVISSILSMYSKDAARDFELLRNQYPDKTLAELVNMLPKEGQ